MQVQSELPPAAPPAPLLAEVAQRRRVHPLLLVGLVASLGAFCLLALPDLLSAPVAVGGRRSHCHGAGAAAAPAVKAAGAPAAKAAAAAPAVKASAAAPAPAVAPAEAADDEAPPARHRKRTRGRRAH
jgi:hypothetical protein